MIELQVSFHVEDLPLSHSQAASLFLFTDGSLRSVLELFGRLPLSKVLDGDTFFKSASTGKIINKEQG